MDQQWIGLGESHKHFFQENMAREHLASCMQKLFYSHRAFFSSLSFRSRDKSSIIYNTKLNTLNIFFKVLGRWPPSNNASI